MMPPALRPLSVGEILDVSFTLYRRHFAPLATVALICSGIPMVLNLFLQSAGGILSNLPLLALYYVVFAVLNSIATAATVFIVSESYLGRPVGAREALRRAAPYFGRILVCSMLLELVAHGEPGLSAADDGDAHVRRDRRMGHVPLLVYS